MGNVTDTKILIRKANTPLYETSDGLEGVVSGLRDASLIGVDWYVAKALEGRGFIANVGTLTTPTTFNATIAAAEQDLYIAVPSGTIMIPTSIFIGFEDTGTVQVLDVCAVASNTFDSAVTGTAIVIYNKRTDAPRTSACVATAVVTAAGTTPYTGNFYEFWRPYAGFGDDAFNGNSSWVNSGVAGIRWDAKSVASPPIIVGQGSLSIYAAAQAGTGFIIVEWIELPASFI